MATVKHKIYVSSISTGDAKGSIKLTRSGKITAICWHYVGTAGADTTGFQRFELAKQSASSFTVNDTPPTVMCYFAGGAVFGASAGFAQNGLEVGLSIPVNPGDILYLHELIGGTAPASGLLTCMISIDE
jgi:hypothetical protein